jgi:hypothetical protein
MGATMGLWAVVTLPLGPCPGPEGEVAFQPDARQLAELRPPLPCVPRQGPGSEAALRRIVEGALGPLAPAGVAYHLPTEAGALRLDGYVPSRDLGYLLTCGGRAPGIEEHDGRVPGELGRDLGPAWSSRVLIIFADDPTWQGAEGQSELARGIKARSEQLERLPVPALPVF